MSDRRQNRAGRGLGVAHRWRRPVALAVLLTAPLAVGLAVVLGGRNDAGGDRGGSRESPSPGHPVRARREPRPVRFTIEASGDLLIHTPVWERALTLGGGDYDFAPLFKEIRPYVAGADLALCHVETPMTPAPPTSYPIFNTPPALAQGIKATGWDVCDTASNHSLDQTQTGVDATGEALDHAGIEHTGSFPSQAAQRKPTIARIHGVRIAFLAYTTDTNGIPAPHKWSVNLASADRVLADARRARNSGADAVIVNLHWGGGIVPEYEAQPSAAQLDLAKKLTASRLITALVGQGPHVVQPIEHIDDKFVVFSEGNLISNQSPAAGLPAPSQDGLIALLRCVARGAHVRVRDVSYVPVFVNHPDFEVLPAGDALKKGAEDAALLRASYERTVSIIGKDKHIEPVPPKLPASGQSAP